MLPLADAGFHVLAPDQRGYGRSGGTDVAYDDDLSPFSTLNRVRDLLALTSALGHRWLAAVIGHDFGSPVAAWCGLTRPDVFRSVVMMSAPFAGAPSLPFNTANRTADPPTQAPDMDQGLAALTPARKHYQTYYTTREANTNMWHASQGVHAFLRAYYHAKSADWPHNTPHPLAGNTPAEFAQLPRYYVMDKDKGMAEQVAADMPTRLRSRRAAGCRIASCPSMPQSTDVPDFRADYSPTASVARHGCRQNCQLFAGRTIDVPAAFLSGKSDWGVFQRAGSYEAMQKTACTKFWGAHLIDGAGHWVQQEQAEKTAALILDFLRNTRAA